MSDPFRAEYRNVPFGYIETKDGLVKCPHTDLYAPRVEAPISCMGCGREWVDLKAWEADTGRVIMTVLGTKLGTPESNDIVGEGDPLPVTEVIRVQKQEQP